MSGNHYGWGNQQGWGPPPQYGGYPGYPPPKPRKTLQWWHFVIAGGVVVLLLVIGGVSVWLIAARVGSKPVATPGNESGETSSANSGRTAPQLPYGARPLHLYDVQQPDLFTAVSKDQPQPPRVQTNQWRVTVDASPRFPAPQVVANFPLPKFEILQVNRREPYLASYFKDLVDGEFGYYYEVWSLTSGERIGLLPLEKVGGERRSLLAISPDGKRIAVQAEKIADHVVTVASLSGDVEKQFELKIKDPSWLLWLDENRLMVGGDEGAASRYSVHIHHLADGKVVEINDEQIDNVTKFDVSPGGKYIALQADADEDYTLLVFDTESGERAGEIQLAFEQDPGDLIGIAFSPDGRQLACLASARGTACHLAGVDVATGASAFSHVVTVDVPGSILRKSHDNLPKLQWLAHERSCLLYGVVVVDCLTGASTSKPLEGRLKPLPMTDIVLLDAAILYGNRLLLANENEAWQAVDLGSPALATSDNEVPSEHALTPTDFSGLVEAASTPVSWSVPPTTPAPIPSPLVLALPAAAEGVSGLIETGRFNSVCCAKPPIARVFVSRFTPGVVEGVRPVHPYDIASGKPLPSIPIPRACELVGVDDDFQLLTINRVDGLRVDLWSAADGAHVRGWQPFESGVGASRQVAWADFASDGKVLTMNGTGNLICWAAAAPRALYRRQLGAAGLPRMNSTRHWLIAYDGKQVQVIDANSGHNLGSIELPGRRMTASALRGDDRMLAALIELDDGSEQLCVLDLSIGRVITRFAPNTNITQPVWIGDHHLLCNGGAVIDLNAGLHVWTFPLEKGAQLGALGGTAWLLDRQWIIACRLSDLPSGRKLIDAFAAAPKSLFGPDDEVSYSGEGQLATAAEECITGAGYLFKRGARRKLRVTANQHNSGKDLVFGQRFSRPGGSNDDQTIGEVELIARVDLLDESGVSAWSTEYTIDMPSFLMQKAEDDSLESAIRRDQDEDCARRLETLPLPQHIYQIDGRPVALPGRSKIADELFGPAE